uniref:Collagen, type XII, alpha 1b n=1 Tax=Oreochromis aureus TaxID=47969 RepID=A0AAZ1XN00_OREAU
MTLESWSLVHPFLGNLRLPCIGRHNFKTMRNFIARMVSVFDIGPDRVQIGLAQYSGDPKTEWHLNAHSTKESLLNAVANFPYKGGNTMTGMALNHILQYNFKPNVGLRPDSHKIGILITDGKSQDEVILTSQNLRDSGIELYSIGVKNADENELRSIASDPDDIHMYNVYDFNDLLILLSQRCQSLAPTNLVTSEVTESSFRATWTPPNGTVEKYHVTYMMTAGERIEELLVNGSVSTVVLENLNPLTEYVINVYAVIGKRSSEPLRGTETTRECFLFCFSVPFELVEASFRRKFNSSASAVWFHFPKTSQPLKNTPSVSDYAFSVVAF